jgi:hypothetical protein
MDAAILTRIVLPHTWVGQGDPRYYISPAVQLGAALTAPSEYAVKTAPIMKRKDDMDINVNLLKRIKPKVSRAPLRYLGSWFFR